MGKTYEYDSRVVVEFSDKTRASYSRKRYGALLEEVVKQSLEKDHKIFNPITICDDKVKIYYYLKNKDLILYTIVDKDDYYEFELWNYYWQFTTNKTGTDYPFCRLDYGSKNIRLHHLISRITDEEKENGFVPDHIDNNVLNNVKSNLRVVTLRDNNTNLTNQLEMGVCKTRDKQGWRARWSLNGKDFEKNFYGIDAYEEAKKHRLKMIKECKYLCCE